MIIDFWTFCVVKDLSNTRQEKNQLEKIGSNNRRLTNQIFTVFYVPIIACKPFDKIVLINNSDLSSIRSFVSNW